MTRPADHEDEDAAERRRLAGLVAEAREAQRLEIEQLMQAVPRGR